MGHTHRLQCFCSTVIHIQLGCRSRSYKTQRRFIQSFIIKTAALWCMFICPISLHYRTYSYIISISLISLLDTLENDLRRRKIEISALSSASWRSNNESDQERSDGILLPAHVAVILSRLRSSLWTYLCGLSLKSQGTKGGGADYKNHWGYGVSPCAARAQ